MEATEEGRAIAAATREAARAVAVKREADTCAEEKPPPKKPHLVRPVPSSSHDVAIPDGFDRKAAKLDPEIYGTAAMHGTCMHHVLRVHESYPAYGNP